MECNFKNIIENTMKTKFILFFLLGFVICIRAADTTKISNSSKTEKEVIKELKEIYVNLEYNTSAFNDLKEKWIITDQTLIRNIYNQFLAKDQLRLRDKKPSKEYIRYFTEAIYDGKIIAKVTKRYFDNEVEKFSFSLRGNDQNLIKNLRLNVKYGSGKIDVLPFTTIVKNSLKGNIDISSQPDTIDSTEKVLDIFNSLNQNHLLNSDEFPISFRFAELFTKEINQGRVSVKITRSGNNISSIEFISFPNKELVFESTQYLPDTIIDGFYLKEVVGQELYSDIKAKDMHIELSKEDFTVDESYNFDINLNFFNPELMFWQSTSEYADKYLLSAFGKWGNDYITVPGWFGGDYIAGAKLSYVKNINNTNDSSYSIAIGSSFKGGHTFPQQLPEKKTYFSGRSLYVELIGNPFSIFDSETFQNFKLKVESKIQLEKYSYYDYTHPKSEQIVTGDFFTVQNYLNAEIKKYNITDFRLFDILKLGKIEAGIGYSLLDMHHYNINKETEEVENILIEGGNQQHIAFVELGVAQREGLFQTGISTLFNYNFSAKYGYFTLKVLAMLNNTFGLDLRFSTSITDDKKLPLWRNGTYFTFSPIIRINF